MPFIQAALDEAKESEVVPEGEYELICHSAELKPSKKGNRNNLNLLLLHTGADNAVPITEVFSLAIPEDEPQTKQLMITSLARALTQMGIPFEANGFNSDDLVNVTFRAFVTKNVYTPEGSTEQRENNKVRWNRLPEEGVETSLSEKKKRTRA